jgi:hypothetical protein
MFRKLFLGLVVAFTVATSGAFAHADAKVPSTVQEHVDLATQYKDKAEGYRKEAADHRAMAAEYAKAHQPTNGPTPNVSNVKMQKHCETIAKDAEKLAVDNEKAADYHSLRAKELQGK